MRRLIEGLALERPRLPCRSIHRQIQQFAEAKGEPLPSYWLVRTIVRQLVPGLLLLAHDGPKAYSETFDLVHRREASRANAIWQADHAQLDILVLRDDGSAAKPWLTIVIDDYSRAVAGYYLAFEPPSVLRTALALRQGIWRKEDPHWPVCGIPSVLYTDHGADFTSLHIRQAAADLKMQLIFATPGQPRGRGRIERFFRTVNEMFLCDLDGYLHRSRRKPILTLESLEKKFWNFLLEVYHRRPSQEGDETPLERWEKGGFLPHMPDSLEQLDLLLMHAVKPRKVRRDGVHFERLRYLSPVLAAYVGEEVTVRFDPRDMGEVRIFYRDRFLCRAISAELAGATVSLREIVRARNARRRELNKILRDRREVVDSLLELRRGQVEKTTHASSQTQSIPSNPASSVTGTNDFRSEFIPTLEHRRFTEFCETCRRYRYVGLCYGTPGVGKTLSARYFSRAELARTHDAARREPIYGLPIDTAFYTATVINSPARVAAGIKSVRDRLILLAQGPIRRQAEIALDTIRIRNENYRQAHPELAGLPHPEEFLPRPTYFEGLMEWEAKAKAIGDPTTLILIDETDRLRTDSLEEIRSLFDDGGVGLVLIGMPGIEKRMARYPQLYSRIGFVHEFQPLDAAETKALLQSHWTPRGVTLPADPISDEVVAAIFRITGGNFRLVSRMLTQVQRILEINGLKQLSKEVVEAARESLVIGSS